MFMIPAGIYIIVSYIVITLTSLQFRIRFHECLFIPNPMLFLPAFQTPTLAYRVKRQLNSLPPHLSEWG